MKSNGTAGVVTPPVDARLGTKVLYGWAAWRRSRGTHTPATRIETFALGELKLVVHEYGSVCGLLTIGESAPKLRRFKVWSQPFRVVQRQLMKHGWRKSADKELEVLK